VLLGRVDLVVLAAPFALALVAGLAAARPTTLDVHTEVDVDRIYEGDDVTVTVELGSARAVDRVELALDRPDGLVPAGPHPVAVSVPAGSRRVELGVRAERWGIYGVDGIVARARDRSGLFTHECSRPPSALVRVHPSGDTVATLVRPQRTGVVAGNQVARAKGTGIEHADLRPFVPGDRVREVNWRATARRGELWVNERLPERSTDLVVFLDAFNAAAIGPAVRVAVSLASAYLAHRDRVGLVSFGGTVSWVRPGMGEHQRYRLIDALLGTKALENFVWKGINVIPRGTLPPRALVLAVTPLEDDRAVAALFDLRNRGIDLAVVELGPDPVAVAGADVGDLGRRLWAMRREMVRDRYRRLGVPVVTWQDEGSLEQVMGEVQSFRRHGRRSVG
jgi:uncharacterized protein (DUF58 family)